VRGTKAVLGYPPAPIHNNKKETAMWRASRVLYPLAIMLGLSYILLITMQPYPLSWLLKMAPMLIFAWLVWRAHGSAAGVCLGLGFVAAAAGDFFLDYGNRDGLFIQALLSFLLNQIAFAIGFCLLARGGEWRWVRSIPVLMYSALLAVWMVPAAQQLAPAVGLYLLSLCLMAVCAGRVEPRLGPVWLGAMLFVVADSLIGLNTFVMPFEHSTLVIVILYFSGQSLIAWGLLARATASATSPVPASSAG
jgi:alkenylglycerophosphocholine/alkenylglycerophosphoethanolamine hydrolase